MEISLLGDVLGSFYTTVRWDITGSDAANHKVSHKTAPENAHTVGEELRIAQAKVKAMEKAVLQLKSMKTEPIKVEEPVSEVSSETTLKSTEETDNTSTVKTSNTKRYAIIIASYKSEEVAQSLARELGNTAQVIPVPEIARFRVAYDIYDTYKDAKNNQEELVLDFENCWIVEF